MKNGKKIIETLNEYGHTAYFAGGCVRDHVLGRTPKDIDIATSALPEEVEEIFSKEFSVIGVGKQFGTLIVIVEKKHYEVTTFRGDGDYSDGRHPDEVKYTESAEEDSSRRDFTINGMFMSPDCNIRDYSNGMRDIQSETIRTIGEPFKRFEEDRLRMLRAVRFSAQLGFVIERHTWYAINENASSIGEVSAERIRDELNKILLSKDPREGFSNLHFLGLLGFIMPELCDLVGMRQGIHHNKSAFQHTFDVVENVKPDPVLRWGALLHDIGKSVTRKPHERKGFEFIGHEIEGEKIARKIMTRLKFPNDMTDRVCLIVRRHMGLRSARNGEVTDRVLRRFARKCGSEEALVQVLAVLFSDHISHPGIDEKGVFDLLERFSTLRMDGNDPTQGQNIVDGHDIMEIFNLKPGPEVGFLLGKAQEICDMQPNMDKTSLICRVALWKKEL